MEFAGDAFCFAQLFARGINPEAPRYSDCPTIYSDRAACRNRGPFSASSPKSLEGLCANANEVARPKAVANATVRSHGRFLLVVVQEKVLLRHRVPPAFSAIEAAKLFSFSKAKNASATVFHRNPSELGGRAEFGSLGFCGIAFFEVG